MGDRVFGRGLAHRTRDADGRLTPEPTNGRGQRLEGDESVINGKKRGVLGIPRALVPTNLAPAPKATRPPASAARGRVGWRLCAADRFGWLRRGLRQYGMRRIGTRGRCAVSREADLLAYR